MARTCEITNIIPVQYGIPIEGVNGAPTTYAVQMIVIDNPNSSVLVIATGTSATGEELSLLFPGNTWMKSDKLVPIASYSRIS